MVLLVSSCVLRWHGGRLEFDGIIDRMGLSIFDRRCHRFDAYIDHQKTYLEERDRERRNGTDLLTRARASINSENDAYHRQMLAQGEQIEQITRLDEIRKIKSTLEREVQSLRKTVQTKQEDGRVRIASLSSRVATLLEELASAKEESMMLPPGASRRNAAKKARQLCAAIAQTRYTPDDDDASILSITASIGGTARERRDDVAALFARVDKALCQTQK